MSREASRRSDAGSAAVEFTLVAVLVVFLVVGVLQLALALHVRNTLVSAAAEGARVAASAELDVAAGEARTAQIIAAALGGYDVQIAVEVTEIDGASAIKVTATAPVPIVGLWGFGSMSVSARALVEEFRG